MDEATKKRLQELAGIVLNEEELIEGADDQAKKMFGVFMGGSFDRWYTKDFTDFIEGEEDAPSQEEIMNEIKRMFKL